jgi:hypothetical protein
MIEIVLFSGRTNALAYFTAEPMAEKKSFVTLRPDLPSSVDQQIKILLQSQPT